MSKDNAGKRPRETITRLSDVAEWGEKDQRGAYSRPFKVPGEELNVDELPAMHEVDGKHRTAAQRAAKGSGKAK